MDINGSIKNLTTLLSVLIAFGLQGFFSGGINYLKGAPMYSSSAMTSLDESYFLKINRKQEYKNFHVVLREKQRIKNKIFDVISSYSTGLDEASLSKIPQWIYEASQKYDYDPFLLTALIVTESSFNNWAKSHRGALGLMQIRPRTGHAMATEVNLPWEGKPTLFKPESNITLGTYYLNKLQNRFNNDVKLALEAYNHGPTKLERYIQQGKRLPADYSDKVLEIYDLIRSSSNNA
jgi:soluble lytic murein transglycosylase-like protein